MQKPIYLDYNATTPVDPRVVEQMNPYFTDHYGNPSSKSHAFGWAADEATAVARERLASLIGAAPEEIRFTGGATEAINLAIKGIARAYASKGRHIITCETEHSAVKESCRYLQSVGYDITLLQVDRNGRFSMDALKKALRPDTILVSLMWANNETGVVHPIHEIAELLAGHPALFLTDATQAIGKLPVDVAGIDLLACSAHKFYGPKGVGALYVHTRRPAIRLTPLIHGGSQENGLRAGTLNVPGIVGLGAAAEIAKQSVTDDYERLGRLRDGFERTLRERIPDLQINGEHVPRLPQTSNVTIPGVQISKLLAASGRIAASLGSACSSESGKPSHVLSAMGLSREESTATLRISFGRPSTEEDAAVAADTIAAYVDSLRMAAEDAVP